MTLNLPHRRERPIAPAPSALKEMLPRAPERGHSGVHAALTKLVESYSGKSGDQSCCAAL